MAKDTSKELEDTVYGVLVLGMALSGGDGFLPEGVVGLLEGTEVCRDGLLVALDGSDAVDDGVDVHEVALGDVCEGIGRGGGIVHVDCGVFALAVCGLLLALDEAEEVWLAAVEVGVFEVPWFGISVALQDALLQMRNFVKPVHVQLSDKGRELLVLEPASEDFESKRFMVEDCRRRTWVGDGRGWGGDGEMSGREEEKKERDSP